MRAGLFLIDRDSGHAMPEIAPKKADFAENRIQIFNPREITLSWVLIMFVKMFREKLLKVLLIIFVKKFMTMLLKIFLTMFVTMFGNSFLTFS